MRNYKIMSTFVSKGTRLLLFVAMLFSLITSSLAPASVALAATNNIVTVTVQDTAAGPLAGRTVYVFDGTGLVYLGLFGATDGAGQVTFDLPTTPSSSYKFASDDVNAIRYFSPTCDVTSCIAATIEEPLFGTVTVTLTDASAAALAGKTVYVFDSAGPTYKNISKVTDGSGLAVFDLPAGSYVFASDDVNNVRYFSSPACVVTGVAGSCGAASIVEPVFGSVTVTVQDTNSLGLDNRVVYVYDGTGSVYQNLFATTDGTGTATFNLPAGNYQFASDDVNAHRYYTGLPACTVPGCTTATITEPVFGTADVTVTDGVSLFANRIVYLFDGTGSTYLNLSAVTDGSGVAHFNLGADTYTFATDDANNMRHFSTTCAVPACSAVTLTLPVFGGVGVSVADANGPLANRTVYVFDGTGTTYQNISGVTGAAGEPANFNLPSGDYTFASDDVNNHRYFSALCTVPGCATATVNEPVFGTVSVLALDGSLAPVTNQTVYVFDGTATTYQNLSALTDGSGVATFNLPVGSYRFAADDVLSQRFFSYPACTLPGCASATVILADVADLGVTKSVDQSVTVIGSTINFTIVASNAGPNAATNVVVNDLLPAGLTFVSDDGAGAYVSASGVWTIGPLAAGSSATLHIAASINFNTNGMTIANTASVSATQSDLWPANDTASASVSVGISDLCATTGSVTMPDGAIVPIWGYVPGDCTDGAQAQLPGPKIGVIAGNTVSITLHNNLPEDTALVFQGQSMAPDFTPIPNGGSRLYTFTATNPGTFLYEAGLLPNVQHQVAMGLYGAVIVYPATAGQAYNSAATAYDDEALLVLSEIDPNLNNSASPAAFDMRDFAGKYFLINGKAYPSTDPIQTQPGNTVLLRYVNASLLQHSMTVLGVDQQVIAYDASPLTFTHRMVAETFGPGQTVDVLVDVSATAAQGTRYPLYDGNLMLHNSSAAGFGGMLTFIDIGTAPGSGGDVLGPQTSGLGVSPSPTNGAVSVALSASVSEAATGGANVTAAEYFIDAVGANGAGTAMSGPFGSLTVNVSATLSTGVLAGLADGNHVLYVHGQDSIGNWGSANTVVLKIDRTGPAVHVLTMMPNPTNGTVAVTLTATADDRATGNGNIVSASFSIDGGPATAMAINITAPVVSLSATFPVTTLAEGNRIVTVSATDALGNTSSTPVTLVIDKTGPTTTNVVASPNPTNGVTGVNSSTPAVRLTATMTDTVAKITMAEGFIQTVGANGTGFQLVPSDGLYNSLSENAYVDIPFSTIAQLPNGNYTLYVHGKDAAGNWGPVSSTVLVVSRIVPDVANVAIANAAGAKVATLTANATNAVNNIARAEWFIGADPGQGNAVLAQVTENGAVAKLAADINVATRPNGTYTVYIRAMDAAGNWSNTGSSTLIVNNVSIFVPPSAGAIKRVFIPMLVR